ncbi:hypothetical protein, partial [Serratia marcescens]|uniref:hypothetical protein n=1 Tax=Serratia marcescens TaxID=615 RepID=UPI001BD4D3CC
AIAIIATTSAIMTIAVPPTAAMTAAASLIHRATPARIVNPEFIGGWFCHHRCDDGQGQPLLSCAIIHARLPLAALTP